MSNHYAYQGVLGEVVPNGRNFFAWKDGFWMGTYNTLEVAMEALVWRESLKERLKTKREMSRRHTLP
jgi:hypothetical protein